MRAPVFFAVTSMLGVQAMTSMAIFAVAVIAPAAAPEIGVDATDIGAYTSIIYISGMVVGLMSGVLIARHGAIRVSQAAVLFSAAGMLALAAAWFPAVILSAVLLGVAYGPINPASAHILSAVSAPRWRPLVFSIKQTGVPVGGALAGIVVPLLVVQWGWQVALLVLAALAAAVALAMQPLRRKFDSDRDAAAERRVSLIEPLMLAVRHPTLRRLAVTGFGFAGCQVAVGAFFVVFLTQALGMGLVVAGLVFSTMQAGGIVGRIFWGSVAARLLSSRLVLAMLGLLIALATGTAAFMGGAWPVTATVMLAFSLGASSFGWNGVYLAEVARHAPDGRIGDATGGAQFIMFSGVVVVPPLFGVVVAATGGYGAAFAMVAVTAAAAGLVMLWPFAEAPHETLENPRPE